MLVDYTCNNYNKAFVIDANSRTKFGRKGGPENYYIFEALGLNFWRFPKQIRKQISVN
jgi:hypothetical protein